MARDDPKRTKGSEMTRRPSARMPAPQPQHSARWGPETKRDGARERKRPTSTTQHAKTAPSEWGPPRESGSGAAATKAPDSTEQREAVRHEEEELTQRVARNHLSPGVRPTTRRPRAKRTRRGCAAPDRTVTHPLPDRHTRGQSCAAPTMHYPKRGGARDRPQHGAPTRERPEAARRSNPKRTRAAPTRTQRPERECRTR
jgi:hypothetical protein